MRTPKEVWSATSDDARWIDDQVAMVAQIMREAFDAGMRAGVEFAVGAGEHHATELAANLALRLPPSVAAGLRARIAGLRDAVARPVVVDGAWFEAIQERRRG
ncbi:MAG: hypothetical protein RJA36_791 [Pseudomonadota bacterium]|jgi:hypothetical protein